MSNDYRNWKVKRTEGGVHLTGPALYDHEDEVEVVEKSALKALITKYVMLQGRIGALEAMDEDLKESKKEAKKHIKLAWEQANKNEEYILAAKLFDILKKIDPSFCTESVSE